MIRRIGELLTTLTLSMFFPCFLNELDECDVVPHFFEL